MAYEEGDALVIVRGAIGSGEEWANTWAVKDGVSSADPQTVADAFHEFYERLHEASPAFFGSAVDTLELRYHNLFTGEDETVDFESIIGSGSADNLPSECALRISLRAGTRRGGPFLAPGQAGQLTAEGQLTTAVQGSLASYVEELLVDIFTAGSQVGLHSPTDEVVMELTGAKLGQTFDVITARRRSMPESYVGITVPS